MLPLIVGTTCIVRPEVGIPLALGSGLVQRLRGRARRKRRHTGASLGSDITAVSAAHVPPVALQWDHITATLTNKKGATKVLLSDVSGHAAPGRLLALMGPSGSGKTTLLNALAGQVPVNKRMQLSGVVRVNGQPASGSNHRQAFVAQEDVFYSQLTVLETLRMAAALRLPAGTGPQGHDVAVAQLLNTLGLAKVADTRVGDARTRGLSGGERKRLSLACELLASPSLCFLDEPTTGLDAAAAEKVVGSLRALAAWGHTVVCSIHQPRSSIWNMFHDLVLLHEGQVVYQGPADQALAYFAQLGYVCPANHNPAEFLADLISPDYCALPPAPALAQQQQQQQSAEGTHSAGATSSPSSAEQTDAARARVVRLVAAWGQHCRVRPPGGMATQGQADAAVHEGAELAPVIPWFKQFKLLAQRSWRQVTRDKPAIVARVMANVSSALVFASIFWRLGHKQANIQDRMGLMQVVAINTAMSSLAKTLNVFPRERLIVNRERARQAYKVAPYLGGKLLAELPISALFPLLFGVLVYPACGLQPAAPRLARFLGAVTLTSFASSAFGLMVGAFAPTTEAAMAIGPAAMTVWIVFGGYYVQTVPALLRWLPKASLIRQAFAALAVNEFSGAQFTPDAQGRGMTSGQEVLDWLGLGATSVRGACLQQLRITACYYVAAYSILCANKPRFQPLLLPAQCASRTGAGGAGDPAAAVQHDDVVQMQAL